MKLITVSLLISVAVAGAIYGIVHWRSQPAALACMKPDVSSNYSYQLGRWSHEPFDNADWPFVQRRDQIDRQFAECTAEERRGWMEAYKRDAYNNPQMAEVQYAYAYATFLIARDQEAIMTDKQFKELLCGVHEWMCMPPPQNSFEYSRLHFFIVEMSRRVESNSEGYDDLAKRLVLRAPDDAIVKFYAAQTLPGTKKSDIDLFFSYAKQVQKAFPKRYDSYYLLSMAWSREYSRTKSQAAFDKLITYKRQAADMLPLDSPRRSFIEWDMKMFKRANLEDKKEGKVKP